MDLPIALVRRMRDNQTYLAHEIAASLVTAMDEIGAHMKFDYEADQVEEVNILRKCNKARIKVSYQGGGS